MTVSTPEHGAAAVAFPVTHHQTIAVGGVNIFYRQAGPEDAPVVLLLHGFPTSSHMFRNLIPYLGDSFLIAPIIPVMGKAMPPIVKRSAIHLTVSANWSMACSTSCR